MSDFCSRFRYKNAGQLGRASIVDVRLDEIRGTVIVFYEEGLEREFPIVSEIQDAERESIRQRGCLSKPFDFIDSFKVRVLLVNGLYTPAVTCSDGSAMVFDNVFWDAGRQAGEMVQYNAMIHEQGEAAARFNREAVERLLGQFSEKGEYGDALARNAGWIGGDVFRKWHYFLRYKIQDEGANPKLTELIRDHLCRSAERIVNEGNVAGKTGRQIHAELNAFLGLITDPDRVPLTMDVWRNNACHSPDSIFQTLRGVGFFSSDREESILRGIVEKLNLAPGQKYMHVGGTFGKVVTIEALLGVRSYFVDYKMFQVNAARSFHKAMLGKLNVIDDGSVGWVCKNIDDLIGIPGWRGCLSDGDMESFDVISLFHVFLDFWGDLDGAIENLLRLVKTGGVIWFTPETWLDSAPVKEYVERYPSFRKNVEKNPAFLHDNIIDRFRKVASERLPVERVDCERVPLAEIRDKSFLDAGGNYGYQIIKTRRTEQSI